MFFLTPLLLTHLFWPENRGAGSTYCKWRGVTRMVISWPILLLAGQTAAARQKRGWLKSPCLCEGADSYKTCSNLFPLRPITQWTTDKKLLKASGRGCLTVRVAARASSPYEISTCSPLSSMPATAPKLLRYPWWPTAHKLSFQGISDPGLTESWQKTPFQPWVSLIGWRALCGSQKRCHDDLHTDEPGRELRPPQSHHQTRRTFTYCCSRLSSGESTLEAKLQLKAGIIFSVCVHTKPVRGPWFTFGLPVNYRHK